MINKLKIAVIGATGYTGLELVYLLSKHPKAKIMRDKEYRKKNIFV